MAMTSVTLRLPTDVHPQTQLPALLHLPTLRTARKFRRRTSRSHQTWWAVSLAVVVAKSAIFARARERGSALRRH